MRMDLAKKLFNNGQIRIKYDITCHIQDVPVRFANFGIMQINTSGVIRITGGDGYISFYRPASLEDAAKWLDRFTYIDEYTDEYIDNRKNISVAVCA